MSTVTAGSKQKLVDRIKECVRQGKMNFYERKTERLTSERDNYFVGSALGANGRTLDFSSIANTKTRKVPSEYGPMVDSHETDYTLSIYDGRKGMNEPALTLRTSDDHPEQGQEAKEVNELLVARWQSNLKKIEESKKKLSSEQEEETAKKLLQELDG